MPRADARARIEFRTTDQITAFQNAEVAKWAAVIKSANIKLE